ncbi:uncharacterized protein LOC111192084 isoform X2 [Astyanax mexicanus]|uniref:uncharacterized protein LOC111192084 isoform X2 n=1 Tax=Astyanax mexicanus TaxID=7994 RepID=UPI0020CB55F9|nr:uncharacterized protein LOC111192084 isoform X2 [Astyanax mexicanus]
MRMIFGSLQLCCPAASEEEQDQLNYRRGKIFHRCGPYCKPDCHRISGNRCSLQAQLSRSKSLQASLESIICGIGMKDGPSAHCTAVYNETGDLLCSPFECEE